MNARPIPGIALALAVVLAGTVRLALSADTIAGHPVKLDGQGRLIPWYAPAANAYDEFLVRRWQFIKTKVPLSPGPSPRSNYPQYFSYDGYVTKEKDIKPDNWMNDVGEKVPNWFESARLCYAYSGDPEPMSIARKLIDDSLEHGTSPAGFAWPRFPYTTTNPGDIKFKGFTDKFTSHETRLPVREPLPPMVALPEPLKE